MANPRPKFRSNFERKTKTFEKETRNLRTGELTIDRYLTVYYVDEKGKLIPGWTATRKTETVKFGGKTGYDTTKFNGGKVSRLNNGFVNLMNAMRLNGVPQEKISEWSDMWEQLSPHDKELVYDAYRGQLGKQYSSSGVDPVSDDDKRISATVDQYVEFLDTAFKATAGDEATLNRIVESGKYPVSTRIRK